MLCLPVTAMCTCPTGSTFTPPCSLAIFVIGGSCSWRGPGLILCWMESSSFPPLVQMTAPSQLDALQLAALQLDTGSLRLWTYSFLVLGGHFMSLLLKACCSACCSLNGAKERQTWQPAGFPKGPWSWWVTTDPSLVLRWAGGDVCWELQKWFHSTGLIHVN